MKRLFLVAAGILSFITADAQLGVQAGVGLSRYKLQVNGKDYKRSREFTYTVGAFYDLHLGALGLRPALEYAPLITKIEQTPFGSGILYYRNRLNYLRVSLPVMFNFWGARDGRQWSGLQLGAGPFFGKLLNATSTTHDLEDNEVKQDFKIGSSATDDFKGSDAGLQLYFGMRYQHLSVSVTNNLGYHNISPKSNEKVMTRSFILQLGVTF